MTPLTYAQEGSLAHALAELALTEGNACAHYIGRTLTVTPYKHFTLSASSASRWITCPGSVALSASVEREVEQPFSGEITKEMAEYVQVYVDYIKSLPGELLIEKDVGIEFLTGEEGANSRADVILLDDVTETLTVIDLKYGMGVPVSAEKNPQGGMLLAGAVNDFSLLCDYKTLRFVIHQPRISSEPSVWECSLEQLETFKKNAIAGAENVTAARLCGGYQGNLKEFLHPSEGACKWCPVDRATCPALAALPQTVINVDFEDLTVEEKITEATKTVAQNPDLARFYRVVPLIKTWCGAVESAMYQSVNAGQQPEYKMVAGKKGAREWKDEAEAEATLKSMRLKQDEMYDFKLISPTTAESRLAKDSPKRWARLQPLIAQADGKPTIARIDDKRPAIQGVTFEALTEGDDLV